MKYKVLNLFLSTMTLGLVAAPVCVDATPRQEIDYKAFLGNHDMMWDRIPNRWEVAPYTGNGTVGFTFYQAKGSAKNVISIFTGRHDYYDHRLPHEGAQHLWIYRCRLPLGHFNVTSQGDITEVDLRLDLWNAELVGTIKTTKGSYQVRGLTQRTSDVIYFETDASAGESIQISWHPEQAKSSVRNTLERGGGPKGGTWDAMRTAPYPLPPEPVLSKIDGINFCLQALHAHRGETTTGWETLGDAGGKQVLLASVHHSFPERNSLATVQTNLNQAKKSLQAGEFVASHRQWWHDYYPQSFLTINDAEKEAFYWIQMYKLGSAMSQDGPILDVMGPWYHYTFWPMVWGDLNVQLIYWTHLTANRMSVGESLVNNLDKYAFNLSKNVPERWQDSMALGALFPQDCLSFDNAKTPDMLAWVLHNYWLHCEYAGDRERMRDGLFPLLRKNVNGYLNYLRENPVQSDDGKIHIKMSWSPEYPSGHGQDVNFTIGLLRWACGTLLDINAKHELNDPLATEWQNILDHLVEYQVDGNGLRIGKTIPFEKPHRHYSHLLPFFPLSEITPENPADAQMLRTSLDHWLDVSIYGLQKDREMAVTGYTATGAASMYARLGATEKAAYYLDFLINHKNISPTTMYAEGNPVIETPLSFASSVHDMLLQSWGGKIRVFNGSPKAWSDVAFHQLRTEGAFLVSAKKKGGVTQFVSVQSLIGSPCQVQTDISKPIITINGKQAKRGVVEKTADGFYQVALKAGDTATFTPVALKHADLSIAPIPVSAANRNAFGLNDKSVRLAGHQFYYPEAAKATAKPAVATPTKAVALSATKGQIVRIELPGMERILSLAEVQVTAGGQNIALNRAASASSAVFGGVPALAVDGKTDGDYTKESVTHTATEANPWWEVNLGSIHKIDTIKVFNRTGGDGVRLDPFTFKILDADRQVVFALENMSTAEVVEISKNGVKQTAAPHEGPFPGQLQQWHGFDMYVNGGNRVVVPKQVADGKPWVWRAVFWGHQPQFDIAMLEQGYHVVYCKVTGLLGSPAALKRWDDFYDYLRFEHLFADRAVLEGMSRGGLIVYNWAAANPEKVAAIYADAPVMDFKSWPGGKGSGVGSPNDWKNCLKQYKMTESQAMAYQGNPLDNLTAIAKAGIPILHVVGDVDEVVPVAENTAIAEARYKKLGGTFEVIHKPSVGHHPHSLKDPQPIVDFVLRHSGGKAALSAEEIVSDDNFTLRGNFNNSRIQFEQNKRGHVAFIGGSITEMNGYRPKVCAMLRNRFPDTVFTFTQAGISSTCSDTGAFRLQRDVLSQGPLDMLFVEFAVNDDQDAYQDASGALRGMEGIIAQARQYNPKVDIVMTHFVNPNILGKLQKGQTPPSVAAHSKVAQHYGVSVNHLAQELADLITAEKMDWQQFGGVHPNDYGNTMCATMIANALLKEWATPLPSNAKPQDHPVVAAIDSNSYVNGRFLPFADIKTDANWQVGVPNWKQSKSGAVRARFKQMPMIYSAAAHAKLTIEFSGTAIGAYLLAGKDSGIIRCTVDGQHSKEIDTLHRFSGFNYPMTVMFFNELPAGEHTLELEILENRAGRIQPGGTALRVIGFTAN